MLRDDTKAAHSRLDAALIKYDLTSAGGLHSYLSVHYLARLHLSDILFGYDDLRDESERLDDLQADISELGAALPVWASRPKRANMHALGLIYVMAGSSLGGKVLFKEWDCSRDPVVKNANRFVTRSKDSAVWTKFLAHLGAQSFSHQEIAQIVESANHGFEIFEAANNEIKERIYV